MRLQTRIGSEGGQALVLVVALVALISMLAVTMTQVLVSENSNSSHSVKIQTAFQAAEAGIDDYTSKLVAAGNTWPYDLNWTYPTHHNNWRQLSNGFEYNLEISAPTAATQAISILATGRPQNDTNTADWREIQTLIRPSSIADYYRIVNGNVAWGSGATTDGKIYANGNVTHDGTAYGDIFAHGTITGSVYMVPPAKQFPGSPALDFSTFLASLTDINAAANNGGVYLNNAGTAAWRLVFSSAGTFTAQSCTQVGGNDVGATFPSCGSATTYNVPSNGAIYSPQSIIIDDQSSSTASQILGRVTVASANNVYIGGNISYVTPGQDVLGVIAQNNVWVADWAPNALTWEAAVLCETGTWGTYGGYSFPSGSSMDFTGSSTTDVGGGFSYATRTYHYDSNLQFLAPPWFPALTSSYQTLLFREIPPS